MGNKWREEHDPNYAELVRLLGGPNPQGDNTCRTCGDEVDFNENPHAVLIETDLDHHQPDAWAFCSARCFAEKIGNRLG